MESSPILQGFNAKEEKLARKATKMGKIGSAECRDNFSIVATKLQASGRTSFATIQALSRQRLRRIPKKTTKCFHDIPQLCRETIQD